MLYPDIDLDLYERDDPSPSIVVDGRVRYRAPYVDTKKDYWVCVGTSMTFGRFVSRPFPAILHDRFPTINFGFGHLDSRLLAKSRPHRNILRGASLVIIQYSPLPLYLAGLNHVLEITGKNLIVAFRDIQTGDHSNFQNVVLVPGTGIKDFYPDQKTHDLAANMILDAINNQSNCRLTQHN